VFVGLALSPVAGQTNASADTSGHRVLSVSVGQGVDVEVLDWSGNGPTLILLAGMGNTAHVFDRFAHQFAGFRVLGITRRGFGASGRPPSGYDTGTRAHDILAVLDHLRIDRAVLVGHSLAGEEITKFAATYPTRVTALVYVEAAYDQTKPGPTLPSPPQPATPDDLTSLEHLSAYHMRIHGWRLPEGELLANFRLDAMGQVVGTTRSPDVVTQISKGVERPAYDNVQAPTLAIYSPVTLADIYPDYAGFSAPSKAQAEAQVAALKVYQASVIRDFRVSMPKARVVQLDAGEHYLFLTNEQEVATLIRAFLVDSGIR
jgi:pimeloyl-ACP methyl ester carboxylesterase